MKEKCVKRALKENEHSKDIKGLIYSTINISREQISTQNKIIEEFTFENNSLKKKVNEIGQTNESLYIEIKSLLEDNNRLST